MGAASTDGFYAVVAPLLDDSRKEIREGAAMTLGELGDARAVEVLSARLAKERANDARQAIEAALTKLRIAELTDEDENLADVEPTAQNHARFDAKFGAIDARPKFDVSTLPEVRIGWVLFASVVLGNDDQVASLGTGLDKMARSGSSEQAFRRLEVLERIGSNAAIGWLDHWARRAKSAGLRDRSRAALARLASTRGVSAADLADIVFGDYGLDEHGERIFVAGEREIRARFDATGAVGIVKDNGSLASRFPSHRADDDPTDYERVRDEYRAWRKALTRALGDWCLLHGQGFFTDDLFTFFGSRNRYFGMGITG